MKKKKNVRRPKRVTATDRRIIVFRNLSLGALAVMVGGVIGWTISGRCQKCLR